MATAEKKQAQYQQIRVTLVKSLLGRPDKQRKIAKGLGLTKLQDVVTHFDSPTIRGMVNKIPHLVTVEVV